MFKFFKMSFKRKINPIVYRGTLKYLKEKCVMQRIKVEYAKEYCNKLLQ